MLKFQSYLELMMDQRKVAVVILLSTYFLVATAQTDAGAMQGLKDAIQNPPPNWVGSDPCGSDWVGIGCTGTRVTSITLSSMGLKGYLTGDIGSLSELATIDLSYNPGITGILPPAIGNLKKLKNLILVGCGFTGPIPDTIGNLEELVFLSLNANGFYGTIPRSIGSLSNLYWLDLADNQLEGTIPVSSGNMPGLDMLYHAKHFHMGSNKLSGTIPPQLFSSQMNLIHVLFEGNRLSGNLPATLGLVKSLEVVRFDGNSLNGSLPSNLNNLTQVNEMYFSNNKFSGPIPNLTGMNVLYYLDMSNNSFDPSSFPSWVSTLQSLTTLKMQNAAIQGQISVSLFSLPQLTTVVMSNNQLNGTLDIGTSNGNQLQLIDLQHNLISEFKQKDQSFKSTIQLIGNPVCDETGVSSSYCTVSQPNASYSSTPNNCIPVPCTSKMTSGPNCQCAFPYTGDLNFRSPSFSDLGNFSHYKNLESDLMKFFKTYSLPVDSVSLSNPRIDSRRYLQISLAIFPLNQNYFNRTGIFSVGFSLSNQTYKPPKPYGPYFFIGNAYEMYSNETGITAQPSKSSNTGAIAGAVAGGAVLLVILCFACICVRYRKKSKERETGQQSPYGQWKAQESNNSSFPLLKGARHFSFDELRKASGNFSETNDVGFGGYGKVYKGTLPDGKLIAIKRSQSESMQGEVEFKNEIELLSRVHHKNLVSLIGFCFEHGEQMLIYEYLPNGSLKDTLSGKSGIRLDWIRRLKIILGAARGLAYLHDLANPPIIHRDIKSTNILLDEKLNAKVADFGLSKPMGDRGKGYLSTQVKGTLGYLDPEYYMTQQVTEKSDVYSFGVVMLELITARRPIEQGKYIVREIRNAMDKRKDLYNLHELLDQTIGLGTELKGFEKFVDLALRCVEDSGTRRPPMSEVVKEIENILLIVGVNPNSESASTSASYEEMRKENPHHPYRKDDFDTSGVFPSTVITPH